jgi:hypothetical protein
VTDLNYIPSLTYVPPAHSRVVAFTDGAPMRAMTDAEIQKFNEAHASAMSTKPAQREIVEAVAAERERCAKIAEKQGGVWLPKS